ncbi:MAG: hypothetical protein ABIW79_09485 [Gemmatimonas sp.]
MHDAVPTDPATAPQATPIAIGSFRSVLRALRPLVGQGAVDAAGVALPLERVGRNDTPPTVAACRMLEPHGAQTVPEASETGIVAFLDGIQRSRVVGHLRGSPLVHGTVAAVIRRRASRQLATWRQPLVSGTLFAARSQVGEPAWAQLLASGVEVVDIDVPRASESRTSATGVVNDPLHHPMAARARAIELIALEREGAERRLAAMWCSDEREWLWIDGGIAGNLAINESAHAFGVVKSHNTLYGDDTMIRSTLSLRAGQRSPVFLAGHRPRRAVASWYLRLREGGDGDPLHGLVRVEVAPPALLAANDDGAPDVGVVEQLAAHADMLSSWILAEGAPLSRPDPRWHTLTYGVHACEQYLKAIIGA